MTDAIYFDLDGTLFDDRQYVRGGLQHAGEVLADQTGVDLTDELLGTYFEQDITGSTFDTVLETHGMSADLVPMLINAYHDTPVALSPFPEAEPTLEPLVDEYRLGLITGGTNGREKLDRLGLAEYFDTVFVGPECGRSKRQPEIFEAALDALDVAPDEAMYIGDRPSLDFPQPNRLGMITVRVTTGRYAEADAEGDAQPDYTVDNLAELTSILEVPKAERR